MTLAVTLAGAVPPAAAAVLAGLLAGLAVLVLGAGRVLVRRRLEVALASPRGRPGRRGPTGTPARGPAVAPADGGRAGAAGPGPGLDRPSLRRGAAVLAGTGTAALVGGPPGLLAGALLGAGAWWGLGRLEDPAVVRRRALLAADLPVAADLLAAGVAAGAGVEEVALAVADGLDGPVGQELRRVVALVRLGADPGDAWRSFAAPATGTSGAAGRDPDGAAAFGRAVARALVAGAPLAPALARVAAEQRARHRARAELAARRVGVLAVGPLTLCFLPAFVLVGVVPVVVGVLGEALRGVV